MVQRPFCQIPVAFVVSWCCCCCCCWHGSYMGVDLCLSPKPFYEKLRTLRRTIADTYFCVLKDNRALSLFRVGKEIRTPCGCKISRARAAGYSMLGLSDLKRLRFGFGQVALIWQTRFILIFFPHAFLRPRGTRGPCATVPILSDDPLFVALQA